MFFGAYISDPALGESLQIPRMDGTTSNGSVMECFSLQTYSFKHLHIPKMVVPTGLTEDGRPSAVQFWGRALEHSQMYDDAAALAHDANFLQLIKRVVDSMHAVPEVAHVDAPMVQELWHRNGP